MSHGDKVTSLPRLPPGRGQRRRAVRGDRRRRKAHLRDAVPPRSGAHARRRQAAQELRAPRRGLPGDWTMAEFRKTKIEEIRAGRQGQGDLRPLGRRRLGVAAVLIHEAIGDQLTCVFVDHGLMRLGEAEQVVTSLFRDHYNIPLIHVDASSCSSGAGLAGVTDPRPSARPSARPSSTCSRPRPRRSAARVPGAGHALSRRDRKRPSPAGRRSRSRATTTSAACPSA
jgi:hypothetical protein